jgi:hypothetical protein
MIFYRNEEEEGRNMKRFYSMSHAATHYTTLWRYRQTHLMLYLPVGHLIEELDKLPQIFV